MNDAQQETIKQTISKGPVKKDIDEKIKKQMQLVVFKLEEEEYAVEISEVREILRITEITPLPNTPDFIKGIINVRGKIVVVVDLHKRFNLKDVENKGDRHIILAEIGDNIYGAIVDEVAEVLRIPEDSMQPAPAIIAEKINAEYVKGITALEKRLIIMLDFSKVFNEMGLEEIGDLVQRKADISREEELKKSPMEAEETPEERKERIENLVKEHVRNNN